MSRVSGSGKPIAAPAANTAVNGVPVLGSIRARDGRPPGQLHTRAHRREFGNALLVRAGRAIVLVLGDLADVIALIGLYLVGVVASFTLSPFGMIRHGMRLLKETTDPTERARVSRSRVVNAVGLVMTGAVLVVVLGTQVTHGAWIVCIAMPLLYLRMQSTRTRDEHVHVDPAADETERITLPSRVHPIVPGHAVHKPTLRAPAVARTTRSSCREVRTVDVEQGAAAAPAAEWERHPVPVPLTVLDSPHRSVTRPILDDVRSVHRSSPRDLVTAPASDALLADRPEPAAIGAVRGGDPAATVQEAVVVAAYAPGPDSAPGP